MALIIFKYLGSEESRLQLHESEEYIVGRGDDSAVLLKKNSSLSRKHLKIYFKENSWHIELISKYGTLLYNNESLSSVALENDCKVSIPPYDLYFSQEEKIIEPTLQKTVPFGPSDELTSPKDEFDFKDEVQESEDVDSNINLNQEQSTVNTIDITEPIKEHTSPGDFEQTVCSSEQTQPRLTIDGRTIELSGNHWIIGRDKSCTVAINKDNLSRKHFEIIKTNDAFYIQDLGSSNGTAVNGNSLTPEEAHEIFSGDVINIKNISISFEVVNLNIQDLLKNLPAVASSSPQQGLSPFSKVIKISKNDDSRTKKIRIGAMVMIPLLFGFIIWNKSNKPKENISNQSSQSEKSNLDSKQKRHVQDLYKLAKNHYIKGNFHLCLSEIEKLQNIVSSHEDSSEIKSYCFQGKIIEEKQLESQRLQEEQQRIETAIHRNTQMCSKKMNSFNSLSQLENCLSEAIQYNPMHPEIERLKASIETKIQNINLNKARQEAHNQQVAQLRSLYYRAKNLDKKRKSKKAIAAYKKVVRSQLPDPNNYKSKASRKIASLNAGIAKKLSHLTEACQSFYDKSDYKNAINSCQKVLKVQDSNEKANNLIDDSQAQLLKTLKPIYEDAIIEEQLGSIDSARQKYKKILETDVKGGVFYRRAQTKLKGL